MKSVIKKGLFFVFLVFCGVNNSFAQCSICTKTAEQLGDGPAQGLNSAIIYLMFTPLLIMGYLGYRWWKSTEAE